MCRPSPLWWCSSLYQAKNALAVRAGGLDRGEPAGEVGPVLQGLELGLGERVVVGDVRAGVGLGDAEVGEQERDRLGGHRGAAVGVDGQLVAADALLGAGLADQHLGQGGGLAGGDHPADDVAGVDVQDHVQVVVGPLRRAAQLGDVPRPHLVRARWRPARVSPSAGWVACRRRSRVSPGLAQQPVERGLSSRGRRPRPAGWPTPRPGPGRANRSLCSTSRIACRSAVGSAPAAGRRSRCGTGAGRGGGGLTAGAAGTSWPAARRPPRRRRGRRPAGASSVIAASVTASTSARCPRSRRASPRARHVGPRLPPADLDSRQRASLRTPVSDAGAGSGHGRHQIGSDRHPGAGDQLAAQPDRQNGRRTPGG